MAHFRRWGAVYLLMLLFLGSWAAQFVTQLIEYRNTQQQLGQPFLWSGYWPEFLASTFENWQSEWFQLVFQAVLLLGAKHWIFRVDAENAERIESKIDDLRTYLVPPAHRTEVPGD
ncbi:DUF6766 family protein [Nocardia neocaledoniensis]|uniref:DUF6766 family protein n=1 Tax=Nocardia neocaledoniensis TaxID=236511 RepID=UPI002457A047|nr:DUF6766 family protein [Nocardia neocaledoniensis]